MDEAEYEGIKIRSRYQYLTEGDKPTKFFYQDKEKTRGEQKQIECLIDEKGKERQSHEGIMKMIEAFYTPILFARNG